MRKTIVLLSCAVLCAGCGGAKIKKQQDQIDSLNLALQGLDDKLKDQNNQLAALESGNAELNSKNQELTDDLKTLQGQLDREKKDNESLYTSAESNKSQLAKKLRELIKEKSALGAQLTEVSKAKARLAAKLEKAQFEQAQALKAAQALQAQLDKIGADKAAQDKARAERVARAREEMGALADSVLKELQSEQAKIDQNGEVIKLTLQEPLLFEANQAKLTGQGAALLERVGAALKNLPARGVHIQGHTDNAPIKWELFGRFTSHWDLSAAQAIAVARFLHEHAGLDPMKLQAEGCGEFRPLKSNATEEGRAANRRITFVIDPPQS